jgi:phospholipase C
MLAHVLLLAVAAAGAAASPLSSPLSSSPIKNVIVLMFENRAFDHMLGHLGLEDARIDGITLEMYNPIDPAQPSEGIVNVTFGVVDGGPADPPHDFDSITRQVYGFAKPVNDTGAKVTMNGFVATAPAAAGSREFVMSAWNDTTLPVLSGLAKEFAVFDRWHASIPTCAFFLF